MGLLDAYLIPTIDGLAYGLLLFTVAAGLTLTFGVGDVLNLAHGTMYALGAYAAAALGDGSWAGLGLAVVVGTAAGAAGGGLLSVALAPLTGRGHLTQALLTFGMALAAGAVLVLAFGADDLRPTIPAALDTAVAVGDHRYPVYRLGFIVAAAVFAACGWLVIRRTRAGARVRAVVDDRDMLACLGTSPRTVLAVVLSAGGALAGLAGALGAPIIGPGPRTADTVLLLSLVIVVLGGLGSIGGAFVAAVIVGQVQSLGVVLAPAWAPYLLFAAMAAVLVLRHRRVLVLGGRS
ncbi:branched-chain amino acid ABC transporter permease [Streptosporangium sp. CA-135522]|uniref:branched-chain amino acid ABC transporter permease n=1 Tax=Streptosporangium sp. CA-135522 TaxID=3240072 RepID=UPI003D8B977F